MNFITELINQANYILWTYILVAMLLGCALWFSFKTRFVQFRMISEMVRLLGDSTAKIDGHEKHISSFQAFTISLASRVGTGNLAGVATAITVGGPGAIFWMWVIALLGASSAFVESTLAQLFKVRSKHSYIGGPAYYMEKGLKKRWMGVIFAILITITFGFAFNSVQSNTICAAFDSAFNIPPIYMGIGITILTIIIIFGGVHWIANVSSILVPIMALGYIILALYIVISNITHLPDIFGIIIKNAFGFEQALGGGIGAALMQGIKRGLFSNEAGMGSAPNAAATAHVTHPAKQGFIQALGVFTDTLLICTCTAFIILFSGKHFNTDLDGIQLTQAALNSQIGNIGSTYIAIAILFFAYSSILGNYYYGEANIRFITKRKEVIHIYRILVGGMVFFGSIASLKFVWSLADVTMALMAICNLIAIIMLGKYAFRLLDDYLTQKKNGIKSPVFSKDKMKDIEEDITCW
ncbi:Na+/alanine symporter [uncultured Bacteroides sp.]|uniref:alanine/glycine:cation symporter family protein n=1 Tax=Bacteroides TaxID=816 RepID=UPI00082197CE|nr:MULTISPECIES: alanine/glycine:cation symporter family protein [Bacteroides]MDN0057971.1 alanine/glycine:cation symporter family protein [Bacteroides caecigallinarum]MCR8893474.1 alanine:cation symporter family protein [Bacteroides sp. ET336]MCU6771807.1 alanine:cation symporter family protein [Bacteroides cellulolyticus]MDN0070824.1 alanine/glycine:cation symporter family protein [Bacteroides caecigallinarum]SCI04497.1 Na+/alanine symporter [uncultured Bacteroides sp.]